MIKTCIIAAIADNGVIGDNGHLPWRIKSELKFFKEKTLGKPVIMGRKTFESLKAPLKDRTNIVVTRDPAYQSADIVVATSLDDAMTIAKRIATETNVNEIMIAGGAEIYKQALPKTHRFYLTEIHLSPSGDTLFPPINPGEWREIDRTPQKALDGESADYTFVTLERI